MLETPWAYDVRDRSWNEAYLIRAFLQFNDTFDVFFYNHLATRKFPEQLREHLPFFLRNGGASLWMTRLLCPDRS